MSEVIHYQCHSGLQDKQWWSNSPHTVVQSVLLPTTLGLLIPEELVCNGSVTYSATALPALCNYGGKNVTLRDIDLRLIT